MSSGRQVLVTGRGDGRIEVWDVATFCRLLAMPPLAGGGVWSVGRNSSPPENGDVLWVHTSVGWSTFEISDVGLS